MAFFIKETNVKALPLTIIQEEDLYIPFPSTDSVSFDDNVLLPIGLLSYSQFDATSQEKILIAVPNIQGTFYGDFPFITYSLTSKGWTLDNEYHDGLKYGLEERYSTYYKKAKDFYSKNNHLTYDLSEGGHEWLFKIGGQPPLGQNWCSSLYDEMGDNPELDNYFDVMDEESGPEFESMNAKEITYFDEELEKEFVYLGMFSYDTYLDGGGECIVFYQPELKKVMVVAEFS